MDSYYISRLIIGLTVLAGCTVGPKYTPPENSVATEWATPPPDSCSSESPPVEWWKLFEDPLLTTCIEHAMQYNNKILIADANIRYARALRQVAASPFFPHIFNDVNGTRTYFSRNGPVFALNPSTTLTPTSPSNALPFQLQLPQTQNLYNALFDASWELDLFGKIRNDVNSAEASVGAAVEGKHELLVTITAEVARNYTELRSLQKRVRLLEQMIRIVQAKREIAQAQLSQGYVSVGDDLRAAATLAQAQSLLPDIRAQVDQRMYILSVLTGQFPEVLMVQLAPDQPLPKLPSSAFIGLRSDLLRRRPDIRRAERELAAATADVGVAVARFFPVVTLIGEGGFQSLSLGNLLSLPSKTWALGADILTPIFQGGKLRGNLKAKKALRKQALYHYQQTVLSALEETESSLRAYAESTTTVQFQEDKVHQWTALAQLSHDQFNEGLTDRLALLDNEYALNQSEQQLLEGQTRCTLALMTLYKALGGGWEPIQSDLASNPH